MAPTTITFDDAVLSRGLVTQTVSLRENWDDAWVVKPYLWCNTLAFTVSPTIPSASFSYRWGEGQEYNQATASVHTPLDKNGWYVKVEVDDDEGGTKIIWYGILQIDGVHVDAPDGATNVGRSALLAYGLEIQLARLTVRRSRIDPDHQLIDRAITFNEPNDAANMGNKGPGAGPLFAENTHDAKYWSTRDIVRYFVEHASPLDKDGREKISLRVLDSQLAHLRNKDRPIVPVHGSSLKAIFDRLMDRRRNLCWWLTVDQNDRMQLNITSFNGSTISLASENIPPNDLILDVVFDESSDVVNAVVQFDRSNRYDQIVAVGERKTSTFSLSAIDFNLHPAYAETLSDDYDDGGRSLGDFTGLGADERADKQRLIRDFRAQERLKSVYSWVTPHFSSATNFDPWDLKVKNLSGDSNPAFPRMTVPANLNNTNDHGVRVHVTRNEPLWSPGLRFLRRVPLRPAHDYSGSRVGSNTVENLSPKNPSEWLPPLVWFERPDATDKYDAGDKLGLNAETELLGDGQGRAFSVDVRVLPGAPVIELKVQGAPQHAIADWGDAAARQTRAGDDLDEYVGDYDWRRAVVTVTAEYDSYAEAAVPREVAGDPDVVRRLYIQVPGARMDWIVPFTIVGVTSDGDLQQANAGGFLQNDILELNDVATIAWEWYRQERAALDLTIMRIVSTIGLGEYIRQIGAAPANVTPIGTVITSIVIDLNNGTTQYRTGYAEMDPVQLIAPGGTR